MQPLAAGDPRTIGEYRLVRRIGAGGMGRVYLGRSRGGRTVAVKVVHPHFAADAEFRVRFRREIESARRVGGAWTAPVLDADPDAAVPWVATGYVAGPSLQQTVADHGPLPGTTVRALGAGLAEALAAVHALGLVHRDVKPSNVLLTLDGPRLIDFGIARATDGTTGITSTGASIGSPGYMSPEQVLGRGGVAARSDVFSLGAVLAYAATGAAPFPGESSAALLYHVVHEEPELAAVADGGLRELIAGCLAKRAADRPLPGDVVHALTGGTGAAALTRAGWLPGPLLEQVSRSAVALLDMEAEAVGPPAPDAFPDDGTAASGLVPFPDASTGPGASDGPDPSAGAAASAGPWPAGADADPAALPAAGAEGPGTPGGRGPQHGSGALPGAPERASEAGAPGPSHPTADSASAHPHAAPEPTAGAYKETAAGGTRGGRITMSASAATGTDPGGPGHRGRTVRQLSCTLVLSVAGALAAALLTFGIVFDMMPGQGRDHGAGDVAEPPGAHPSPSGDDEEQDDQNDQNDQNEATGSVPEAFLGTWQGQLSTDRGTPAGILTVTVTEGTPGEQVVTGRFVTAITGERCRGEWRLTRASERELRVLGSAFDGQGGCLAEGQGGEFRLLPDGGLDYTPLGEALGNPSGTLRRQN